MYCNQCGAEIKEGIRFCNKCGVKLEGATPSVGSSVQMQQPYGQQTVQKWESTSVKVTPIEEDETIRTYEMFGWELVSSQTVDNTNSHLENRMGTLYSVTESKNYVKLVFKRDKNMPNYKRIVELEEEYDFSNPPDPPAQPGFVLPGIGLFLLVLGFSAHKAFLIWSIPFILVFVVKWINYRNKNEEYLKQKEAADERRLKCLNGMKELGIEPSDRIL